MDAKKAYSIWAEQYDTNRNRTRDMEAQVLQQTLAGLRFGRCLEIGCGTGKNTVWLAARAQSVTAVDQSPEMLEKARAKVTAGNVTFKTADIRQPWPVEPSGHDLITFSLVLEHIADIAPVLQQAALALAPGGHVYIGELHPFKQYTGTKARFETETGVQEVEECFHHHVSDFTQAAKAAGLRVANLQEYFDENDRNATPRILCLLLQKP